MPHIRFVKKTDILQVSQGSNLMSALQQACVPVASSCLGKGICSKCALQIVKGSENLSKQTDFESTFKQRNLIGDDCRLSCQAFVFGDITIDAKYW
jgi:ferredoxin, 2Fe-2S